MKRFSEKLVSRNYAKRFLALVLAAVILLAGTAVLIPVALRKQISELKTMEDSFEKQEEQVSPKENPGHRDDKEHRIKSALRQLTPVGTGVKVAFAAVVLLFFLLGVCYWITVMEWMYKAAVLYGLNRALWSMLGGVFNFLALLVLLVVINAPKRMAKQV